MKEIIAENSSVRVHKLCFGTPRVHYNTKWKGSSPAAQTHALLISIGKLKPTIGMITYRNTCALDSIGKITYKLILKLLPVIFLGKCSSNSNYFGL